MDPGVVVEPDVRVIGDGAGPAIPLRDGSGRGNVAVVVHEVVVGHQIVAADSADAGAAGIGDRVRDKRYVMAAAAEEAVSGVAVAIEIEALEDDVGGDGRERAI